MGPETQFFFDYRKVFDFVIDHTILVNKNCQLLILSSVINLIIDFLTDRPKQARSEISEGMFLGMG